MASTKNKLFVIRKIVKAKDMQDALKNESKGKIAEIHRIHRSKEPLTPAIGFGYDVNDYDEDYYE